MSPPDTTAAGLAASGAGSHRRQRGTIIRLAVAQALAGANAAVIYATGSIVGATLAPSMKLATVPLSGDEVHYATAAKAIGAQAAPAARASAR